MDCTPAPIQDQCSWTKSVPPLESIYVFTPARARACVFIWFPKSDAKTTYQIQILHGKLRTWTYLQPCTTKHQPSVYFCTGKYLSLICEKFRAEDKSDEAILAAQKLAEDRKAELERKYVLFFAELTVRNGRVTKVREKKKSMRAR